MKYYLYRDSIKDDYDLLYRVDEESIHFIDLNLNLRWNKSVLLSWYGPGIRKDLIIGPFETLEDIYISVEDNYIRSAIRALI